jgi:hypothetical protein
MYQRGDKVVVNDRYINGDPNGFLFLGYQHQFIGQTVTIERCITNRKGDRHYLIRESDRYCLFSEFMLDVNVQCAVANKEKKKTETPPEVTDYKKEYFAMKKKIDQMQKRLDEYEKKFQPRGTKRKIVPIPQKHDEVG